MDFYSLCTHFIKFVMNFDAYDYIHKFQHGIKVARPTLGEEYDDVCRCDPLNTILISNIELKRCTT